MIIKKYFHVGFYTNVNFHLLSKDLGVRLLGYILNMFVCFYKKAPYCFPERLTISNVREFK